MYLDIYENKSELNKDIISFRCIDDVLIIELNGMKANHDFNYYPKKLELKLSGHHNSYNTNHFLVTLKMENKNLITSLFDKRKDFNFKTIAMLNFKSNVHISIFRNIYINGLNRLDRLTSDRDILKEDMLKWYRIAVKQGYP